MFRHLLAPALLLFSLSACAQPASPPASSAKPAARASTVPGVVPAPARALAPRLGTDYVVLPTAQPTYGQGKIEVAEVFSYRCVHCAEFQPYVNNYKKTMAKDIRWEYVPGAFGGSWDDFARAYFAAEVMGVQAKTHDAVFKGVFIDQYIKTGTAEEIAAMYARFGVDSQKFLGTMQSFGVTAKLNRARQFATRTGVDATPTIVVNGKYRVNITKDRGWNGMLSTVNFLVAKERAAKTGSKPAPVAARKP